MAFIETVADEAVYEADRKRFGFVPNFTRLFARRPATYAAWLELNGSIKQTMDPRRYELATVAAARALRSSYCALAHGKVLADRFTEPAAVRAIATDHHSAGLDEVDVAVMDLAQKVAEDAASVTAADIGRLHALGLSDDEGVRRGHGSRRAMLLQQVARRSRRAARRRLRAARRGARDTLTVGRPIAQS
jgi:uncharacterized peroxidase-related enzyme